MKQPRAPQDTSPIPKLPERIARAWLAPEEWTDHVAHELGGQAIRLDRLFVWPAAAGQSVAPVSHWAQNTWLDPRIIEYASINDAARQLRAIQRNWWPYSYGLHRRTSLIQEALPHISRKPRAFPFPVPAGAMGAWCLLDDRRLLASPACDSPFPGGELVFEENHVDPPSTAYLKLWEALTRLGRLPAAGQRCIDAGACPGGWTWVLEGCGAEVLALDRSPLSPRLMSSPRVRFRSGNAFALTPDTLADFGWDRVDWLCSDLICYPAKLYDWVKKWFDSGLVGNFVITLKMQGEADWESTRAFTALPGGRVYHASYNKHELTWVWPAPACPGEAADGALPVR